MEEQASLLGYSLHLPRVVAICSMEIARGSSPGYHDLVQNKIRENILSLMEKSPLAGEQDLAVILNDNLVFLKALPSGPQSIGELVSWGQDMVRLIATTYPQVRFKLAAGSIFSEPCDTFFSYHQANFALRLCPEGHFVSIYDHEVLLAYLLKSVETPENERLMESITNKLEGLAERKYNIINTIRILLECNLNLAETARSLYIHRNTLLFRLKKFKELTGLEPHRNFNDALLCKIAISFLNKSQNTFADLPLKTLPAVIPEPAGNSQGTP